MNVPQCRLGEGSIISNYCFGDGSLLRLINNTYQYNFLYSDGITCWQFYEFDVKLNIRELSDDTSFTKVLDLKRSNNNLTIEDIVAILNL
jgi:hypothetical protein